MANLEAKVDELLTRVTRLNRDIDRLRLMAGTPLGKDRGISLLASGDRLYIDPRDRGCGINLLSEGKYEEDEISIFRRFLRPGGVVLDIGANYGYYSITAAPYVRPGGRVFAFEPNPHIFDLMSGSSFLNGFTDVITPCRMGAFNIKSELRFAVDETGPGGARIVFDDYVATDNIKLLTVPVTPIDDFLPENTLVDLVKLDVEGRERQVLEGMKQTIAASPDIVILMELFYSFFGNREDFAEFLTFLTDELGLSIFRMVGPGRLTSANFDDLVDRESYVVLAKHDISEGPALTLYPCQLNRSPSCRLIGDSMEWENEGRDSSIIAHGPYVYLPKGPYTLKVYGEFAGRFALRLQENFGDLIWQGQINGDGNHEFAIGLRFDAPKMEIVIAPADGSADRMTLDRIEFWNA